ncbi:MAG: hypothetical protein A2X78_00405 [Gammaproteobacteria bacterium GWE2_37_16]|nr:MAG: hypothetical protein A2X78_00405 [Gammaproteobacteria bacterium GWE2_37_16]
MNKNHTLEIYRKRLLKVLLHIEANLDREIPLAELAKVAHFSTYHFHRVFSGMIGESVQSYVRRLKMQRAAHNLLFTEQRVTDIALQAGYESLEAFSKAFKKHFRLYPTCYRKCICQFRFQEILNFINQLPKGDNSMQITVKNIPTIRVACVRYVGPYGECAPAWEKLFSCENLPINADTQYIGIGYDDPKIVEPDKIRYDACVTVPADFQSTKDVNVQEIKSGKYAVVTHIGSYTEIAKVVEELLGRLLPCNGYEFKAQPIFEIYKNDPNVTPPEQLITEIYVPIK